MEIRPIDPGFTIRGDPEEFRSLALATGRVAHGLSPLERRGEGGEAGGMLLVASGKGPVRVGAEESASVRLIGDRRLLFLAGWFRALGDRPGRTATLAWYPGHFYLAENSVPLTLACVPRREG